MRSTAFQAFLASTLCTAGLVSAVFAGPHAGHAQLSNQKAGPGFSSNNNPGFFGRMGKTEHNDFLNRDNNPGVQGSAFGRATATHAGANDKEHVAVSGGFLNRTNWTDSAAGSGHRPNPIPSTTRGRP